MAFSERHKTSIRDVRVMFGFGFSLPSKLTEGTDCGCNFKKCMLRLKIEIYYLVFFETVPCNSLYPK